MTNDVQFKFMGFIPDEHIRNVVSTVAERLPLNSPSDSAMKLVLEKSASAVRASCQVASQAGIFIADAISDNPIRAVQKIERKIRAQLDSWKRHRFETRNQAPDGAAKSV